MFPSYFSNKKRELVGFLHLLKGKLTGDERERIRGANEALNALEDERDIYLREKRAAEIKLEPELGGYKPSVPQDKVQREVTNRDVSAY